MRTLSAIVMVAVAGAAVWLGGYVWAAFVALVAAGVLWEWVKLSHKIAGDPASRAIWLLVGVLYIGIAAEVLWRLDVFSILLVILCVISTDVGAYFSGRTFGGPKIAPRISPSKTWAGLAGGMLAAGLIFWAVIAWAVWKLAFQATAFVPALPDPASALTLIFLGAMIAIIAQTGDFFESWMKRRAGVKDSGNVIPGHGGLFDRVDGLLAVLFVLGILRGTERLL